MTLPKKISLIEVGPRDGLQNETKILSTNDKIAFIKGLVASGLKTIEVTSFVRADRIPQMTDSSQLMSKVLKENFKGMRFPVLVPNWKGWESAESLGVKEISLFTATSESFNQQNINASIDESLDKFGPICEAALKNNIKIRAYLSTVFGCPYEGKTSLDKMDEVITKLLDLGVSEIALSDTIGVGDPKLIDKVMDRIEKYNDLKTFAMHLHDTRGMALVNIYRSMQRGITKFDSAAGGLGGCPYAKGATGNVATEDIVYLCQGLGIETGVDLELLAETSLKILKLVDKSPGSKWLEAYNKSKGHS